MTKGTDFILYPKRSSELTHGELCVDDQQRMYFKFHTYLNPTVVNAVMLRLEQASWLDKFQAIICEDEQDMWNLRRYVPKVAYKIQCLGNYSIIDDGNMKDPVLWVSGHRQCGWYDEDFIESQPPDFSIHIGQLWPVTPITINYRL